MIWKAPPELPLWVYQREDGCDLELYAGTKEEALWNLREFGIVNPSFERLKVREKRNDPVQID